MPKHSDIHISHFLPGRVRLRVGAIKGNAALAEQMRLAFSSVPGVKQLTYNTLTGSVLIHYDPQRILLDQGERLKAVLREQLPDLDADEVIRWLGGTPRAAP